MIKTLILRAVRLAVLLLSALVHVIFVQFRRPLIEIRYGLCQSFLKFRDSIYRRRGAWVL